MLLRVGAFGGAECSGEVYLIVGYMIAEVSVSGKELVL